MPGVAGSAGLKPRARIMKPLRCKRAPRLAIIRRAPDKETREAGLLLTGLQGIPVFLDFAFVLFLAFVVGVG